jgi:hypothetical protein
MSIIKNPFYPKSKDEKEKEAAERERHDIEQKKIIDDARALINTPQFQKYKEQYARVREMNVDMLCNLKYENLQDWAIKAKELVDEIRFFKTVLRDVEIKAKV